MTTSYATLYDTVTFTTVNFMMDPDWQPAINEPNAGIFYPLGNSFGVKSTDGTKGISGTLTIVTTSDAMEATVMTLLQSTNQLTLTMPNGTSYGIVWDGQARKGKKPFSLMTWQPINTWTCSYIQVA